MGFNRFTSNKELLDKRSNNKHYKFNIQSMPDVTWDDVFYCLGENVKKDSTIQLLNNFGLRLYDVSMNQNITTVLNEFSEIDSTLQSSAHLYVSLTDVSNTFGWHRDNSDVLFWQVIGKTFFSVEEDSKIYDYVLEKNDLLYIPKMMSHCTKPLTARAGVSLGLDYY